MYFLFWVTTLCNHASSSYHCQIGSPLQLIFMPGTNRVTKKRLRKRKRPSWVTAMSSYTNNAPFFSPCRTVQQCLTLSDSPRGVALQLFISVYSRSCGNRPRFDTVFKWPHQQTDNQWDKEEASSMPAQAGRVKWGWWRWGDSVYKCRPKGTHNPTVW